MTTSELRAIRSGLMDALKRVDGLIEASTPTAAPAQVDVLTLDRTKAIEWVLEQSGKVMRPVDIWAELQRLGRNDPKMEVQVTTYDLWHRKRIDKIGRGQYIAKSASA